VPDDEFLIENYGRRWHKRVNLYFQDESKGVEYKNDWYLMACVSKQIRIQEDVIRSAIEFLDRKVEIVKSRPEQIFPPVKDGRGPLNLNPTIIWSRSDTDLLELITALVESKAIRNEEKTLTRKDAIEYFSKVFRIEIKDAESKLSRATERKKDVSPFLSDLKHAFDNYANNKK